MILTTPNTENKWLTIPLVIALGLAVLAVAGVLWAGIGGPRGVSGPPRKHAPWSVNWTKVAFCESSGRWHINTGNGFYGGLQFTASTWRAFGGRKYASLPHRTNRRNQKRIAEKVVRGQGIGAWPNCGYRGLK